MALYQHIEKCNFRGSPFITLTAEMAPYCYKWGRPRPLSRISQHHTYFIESSLSWQFSLSPFSPLPWVSLFTIVTTLMVIMITKPCHSHSDYDHLHSHKHHSHNHHHDHHNHDHHYRTLSAPTWAGFFLFLFCTRSLLIVSGRDSCNNDFVCDSRSKKMRNSNNNKSNSVGLQE